MHLKINGEHIRGRIMTVCIGSAWGYGQAPSAVQFWQWLADGIDILSSRIIATLFGNMDADGRTDSKP